LLGGQLVSATTKQLANVCKLICVLVKHNYYPSLSRIWRI